MTKTLTLALTLLLSLAACGVDGPPVPPSEADSTQSQQASAQ
ncbi:MULTISPECIES: argininosuccinate lyase [Thioclava]|nr:MULTISPECIES: argininosuccinate lyase [Thioclava]